LTGLLRVVDFGYILVLVPVFTPWPSVLLPVQFGVRFEIAEKVLNIKPRINRLELITIRPSLPPHISDLNGLQNRCKDLKTQINFSLTVS
jgi:hypothetical protein